MSRLGKLKRQAIQEANLRVLKEQKVEEVPSDTSIVKLPMGGDNNIMVTSKEKDVAHSYKVQIIADGQTFNPNIESIKLSPNKYLRIKIKLKWGTGFAVKSKLSDAKAAMKTKGIEYNYIDAGVTSGDKIIFTIYTDKNSDTRNGIVKAVRGDKPITLTNSDGVKVKLI